MDYDSVAEGYIAEVLDEQCCTCIVEGKVCGQPVLTTLAACCPGCSSLGSFAACARCCERLLTGEIGAVHSGCSQPLITRRAWS